MDSRACGMELMARSILITGGAGFIGANFVLYMKSAHPADRLIVLDKLTYAGNLENLKGLKEGKGYRFVKGDINDASLLDGLFKDEKIDVVVNFAAESHVDRSISGPRSFIETNINGTFTLLEAARAHWTKKEGKTFLHVSTDEVYGSLGPEGYFTEESRYSPNSPYSASKAASDHLVRAYFHTYGLPAIITNSSNNYGPYQFPEKLIPLMILNALLGKPLPIYGDGQNVRDWLYVEDHCRAIDAALGKGGPGQTYNVGGRSERTNIDIVKMICSIIDEKAAGNDDFKRQYPFKGSRASLMTFVADRPGHDRRYATDCSRLESATGWRAVERFESGLGKTVDWYIENRLWWERIMSGRYMDYYDAQYKGLMEKKNRGPK